jgi:predicted HAD superfamily Cof-like phosphohydrolase
MNRSVFEDIKVMQEKFGHSQWVKDNIHDKEKIKKLLSFRILKMIDEEMNELRSAAFVDDSPEEIVDSLIDIMVFSISILDLFGVDGQKAWDEVYKANMNKKPGVKASRPNKFGMPDMIKEPNWEAPSHEDNHGLLKEIY